jgi:UDP-glucose 4-epimerase
VADIRDREQMAKCLAGKDIVFHLACLGVRHSLHAPAENHDVNATATLALLAEAKKSQVGRFVYVSSSEVYGTAIRVPITEEHPCLPTTVYGAAKLAGEAYVRAYFRSFDLPTVVLRPFNCYGPRSHHEGDCGEVIPKFMLRCMAGRPMVIFGNGEQTRDFNYVADIAGGILAAGVAPGVVGETLNIGAGQEISIRRLAELIALVVGRAANVEYESPRPGDVLRLCADSTRASRMLNYRPQMTLAEGLRLLHRWYARLGQTPEELLKNEVVRNWEMPGHG